MAQAPNKTTRIRVMIMMVVIALVMAAVLPARLWYIQMVKGEEYRGMAKNQQLKSTAIPAKRGTIYDRNKNPLAQSATVWTVFISPADIAKAKSKEGEPSPAEKVATALAEVLEVDRDSVLEKCKDTSNYYSTVKKRIARPEVDELLERVTEEGLVGIHIEEDTKRYYPYGSFASTLIGFVNGENQGAYGIEAYYDKLLSGTPGRVVSEKNARGTDMDLRYQQLYEAEDGKSLVLTIDEVVQHYLEKALETAVIAHGVKNRATGIIMDVNTGEILAMATKGDFDPNSYSVITDPLALERLEGLTGEEYEKQLEIERFAQWRNKAVSDPYEPGSVFKLITMAAALESNVVTEADTFYCPGYLEVQDRTIHCWKTSGHGQEDLAHAIINSCNPALMMIGAKLGTANFFKYFQAFGLTELTGIDIPGEATSIYHPLDSMGPVELASSSFGQTFKVTPIQLITAVSAVLNGGKLMQPYVVKQVLDADGNVIEDYSPVMKRQVISEETSKMVASMAERVVSEGSGSGAYVAGYRVGGKTGTSQKLDKLDEYGQVTDHVLSFLGFAPADDPQVACLVLIDEPSLQNAYGSVIAAPVVGAIFTDVLPYLGIEPHYTEEELEQLELYVPEVLGQKPHEAQSYLANRGLNSRLIGDGAAVLKQVPDVGQPVPKGSTVYLYTSEEAEAPTTEVPPIVGLSGTQANKAIINARLNMRIVGTSDLTQDGWVAVSQSLEAGEEVEVGSIITVEFVNRSMAEETGTEPLVPVD